MSLNGRYDVLFEPVAIGPVVAPNRFYQVPHCNGMGHMRPRSEAANRGMKAEGGWGVVCTQETEIHPTTDLAPYAEQRIWDDRDIPALRLMTDAVHEHNALAGIELAHNGFHAQNLLTRASGLAPMDIALHMPYPRQARAADKSDLKQLRKWHQAATLRSIRAGFDIVYVYAGHRLSLAHQFLLPQFNNRGDEYGGTLENRVRLTRELLEDTLELAEGKCAVAFRFAVDELNGPDGMQADEEGRAVVEMLAELPDLWDVNVSGWENDSATTRFVPQDGYQMDYIGFVKKITSKPVVGTGMLTSPDKMVSLVRGGVLDFIGAARPSIADPFLPNKISSGEIEKIRECIGCNICVSADNFGVPIRCTQNPTQGEEWRRGWHPEIIRRRESETSALVVGGGPSGLECGMQLARRGYQVTIAEAADEPGGRVRLESGLPGLNAWRRVADHRLDDIRQRANASIYMNSQMNADAVVELGIPNVFVATGSRWCRDGRGRNAALGLPISTEIRVYTPDDIFSGASPSSGDILVYDDDQGYLAGVLAEHLANAGCSVTYATPAANVSAFTLYTLENERVYAQMSKCGINLLTSTQLVDARPGKARLKSVYTDDLSERDFSGILLVTQRTRNARLYEELQKSRHKFAHLELVGDAAAPGLIADAIWSGHMAAQNFERNSLDIDREWYRREIISLAHEQSGK